MRDKIIRIRWSSPISVDEAIQSDESLEPGLYFITRPWGSKETNLYIGKASRTIRERLIDHKKHWLHCYQRGQLLVRMGKIVYPPAVDEEIIDHAESALIFEHGDLLVENTNKRFSYSYSDLYQVQNIGDVGELKPIVRMKNHPD